MIRERVGNLPQLDRIPIGQREEYSQVLKWIKGKVMMMRRGCKFECDGCNADFECMNEWMTHTKRADDYSVPSPCTVTTSSS